MEDEQNLSSGSGDMDIGPIKVPEKFFENISRNMIVTEKNDNDQYYGEFCCRQYCLWGGSATSSS